MRQGMVFRTEALVCHVGHHMLPAVASGASKSLQGGVGCPCSGHISRRRPRGGNSLHVRTGKTFNRNGRNRPVCLKHRHPHRSHGIGTGSCKIFPVRGKDHIAHIIYRVCQSRDNTLGIDLVESLSDCRIPPGGEIYITFPLVHTQDADVPVPAVSKPAEGLPVV